MVETKRLAQSQLGTGLYSTGFKSAVFKYDRFDPPLLSATSSNASGVAGPSEMASHTFPDSSPEFEAMPPLNLDLMSEPEMQDIFNRKTSPLFAAAATNKGQTGTIQSPQDLITFQVGEWSDAFLI